MGQTLLTGDEYLETLTLFCFRWHLKVTIEEGFHYVTSSTLPHSTTHEDLPRWGSEGWRAPRGLHVVNAPSHRGGSLGETGPSPSWHLLGLYLEVERPLPLFRASLTAAERDLPVQSATTNAGGSAGGKEGLASVLGQHVAPQ